MKAAKGHVFKYGDNVDTDVIIPARYLNSFDAQELATHAMVDIDPTFTQRVQPGDIIVARKNFGLRFFQRTCTVMLKDRRCQLHHRRDICTYFLS